MNSKFVYMFSEGNVSQKNLLGGKGANLAEMTNMGLPIPQGFIVSTDACVEYYDKNKVLTETIREQIKENMAKLEEIAGKKFGDTEDPLLVSVRSGARVSMPGMMDTVLNLGLNDESVEGLAKKSGNPRFAHDSYRRFIQMFGDVVMEIDRGKYEAIIEELKEARGVELDADLTDDDIQEMVARYKVLYKKEIGSDFPQDPVDQLMESIQAVFRSWMNPRAIVYRRMNGFESKWGTAVNVQEMVFGNMGPTSGTGVAFTRNPATGENVLYGEYLIDAQGEDVVAGTRTPNPISQLADDMPEVFKQFNDIAEGLEKHYKDMQDMEFTVQDGKLYILQTRSGKRTVASALKIAVDLVAEGMLTKEQALLQVDPAQLDQLLHPMFDVAALKAAKIIGKALPASPGAATGRVYLSSETAKAAAERGEDVILVRLETSPEDIEGMVASKGILTARGGMTSHAAVVARGMGICCVSGCGELRFSADGTSFELDGKTFKEGDAMALDGTAGNIYGEAIATVEPEITGDFETFMAWADEVRTLKVRANADSPADAVNALKFGAQGIGLTRTEHMFFEEDRIMKMRKMIVSKSEEKRREALNSLLPMQKADFVGIYEVMGDLPVTVRLLDPPFHEFLPQHEADIKALANSMEISFEELNATIESLHEFNPMMGHRGCRLAVSYPEIAEMQTRAIIEAALQVKKEKGSNVVPEIMIPLVGDVRELQYVKDIVTKTADALIADSGIELTYSVGTMIEIPRATLIADKIAEEAEFFSFGTNDLTQMTFGFSRDDAGGFLEDYYTKNIYTTDPFARIDQTGVGQLMEIAVEKGRSTRPNIKLGICGEHGGDPSSVEFCHNLGLDYVSCSPFRLPIARLAAAQAAVKSKK
ncbi:MAG TPA: pyruvate, phosphate dikinase [Epulopiscium sp.]|nr:pyruvate, phosphate dikinase [Candidatus Epulonipiscium sp.]